MAKASKKRQDWYKQQLDAQGLHHKKWKHSFSPEAFFLIKLGLIFCIPIVYFVYSPLLIVVLFAYVSLFYLAILAERRLNKSVIKKNHLHIPKWDSALALIVIVIALAGTGVSALNKSKEGMLQHLPDTDMEQFESDHNFNFARRNNWWRKVENTLQNLGSCLTGTRSVFDNHSQFGSMEPPEGFVHDSDSLSDTVQNAPDGKFEMDMDNIPVAYVFSTVLSTANTVLVFSIAGVGLLSLTYIVIKKHRFESAMNEILPDEKIAELTDEELDKILSFGQ